MLAGSSTGTRITNPDFKALAESFGIKGYCPKTVSELKQQLEHTIGTRELSVIEIPVNPSVNSKLTEKLDGYWKKQG